jgi:predicted acetyltransferase
MKILVENLEFKIATKSDIEELKPLYTLCFGEDKEYIDFYFKNIFHKTKVFTAVYQDEIVSFLSLFDAKLRINDEYLSCNYIYGVGTHPDFRGNAISIKLLDNAVSTLVNIQAIVLVPANPSLFDFYSNQGFEKAFYIFDNFVVTEKNAKIKLFECPKDDFIELREAFYKQQKTSCMLDDNSLVYDEILFTKGKILKTTYGNTEYYCVCYAFEDELFIREHSFGKNIDVALSSLSAFFDLNKIKIRSVAENRNTPFGMIKFLGKKRPIDIGYMNFMLD